MDNDIFIPYKFRASQIVGLAKVAVKFIEANGIRFQELDPSKEPPPYEKLNKLSWYNSKAGKVREYIQALTLEAAKQHFLELTVIGDWGNVNFALTGKDNEPTAVAPAEIGFGVVDRLTKAVAFRRLFDSEQRSSFLQLALSAFGTGGAKMEVNWGFSTVFFPTVGGTLSNGTAVATGFSTNRVPGVVLTTAQYGPGYALPMVLDVYERGAGYFAVQGVTSGGGVPGAVTIGFMWLAIG